MLTPTTVFLSSCFVIVVILLFNLVDWRALSELSWSSWVHKSSLLVSWPDSSSGSLTWERLGSASSVLRTWSGFAKFELFFGGLFPYLRAYCRFLDGLRCWIFGICSSWSNDSESIPSSSYSLISSCSSKWFFLTVESKCCFDYLPWGLDRR